jgi:hypothetical protein
MRVGRSVTRVTAVVMATALFGSLATLAGGALKTKSSSTTIQPDEIGSATAKCKRGSEAVSGGFESDVSQTNVFTTQSKRDGKRSWTASAGPISGTTTLTVFAYCDPSKPRLKERSETISIDPDLSFASVTAECGRGARALSGGFESTSPDPVSVSELRRDGKRRWIASGYVNSIDVESLTAFVYCDKSKPRLKTKSASTPIGEFEHGSATATCRRGTEAVSGGFGSPAPETLAAGFPGPTVLASESRREGNRKWTVAGQAGGGGGTLIAYAYCEKK